MEGFLRASLGSNWLGSCFIEWDSEEDFSKVTTTLHFFFPTMKALENETNIVGVILRKTDKERGQYCRAGHFSCVADEAEHLMSEVEINTGSSEGKYNKEDFAEVNIGEDGTRRFVINIV